MNRVTTVIVNYRLKYFLEQTLLSVREAYTKIPGHTIVIDNNSGDDSIDFLKERFPDVTFICNTENAGFAKANNQGFAIADTDYILVLNPDTIIGENTLKETVEFMDSHNDCAAIGVKMIDGNGNFLPESKRSFPSIWNSFCKLFGLSAIFPKSRLFARYHMRYLHEDETHKVEVLAGAFMLLRTSVVKETGGFDEDFFMYGEDMDLSYRMASNGRANYYIPTPIIHYKGECTKTESMNYVKIFYKAMHIFYRKHYPRRSLISKIFINSAIFMRMCIGAVTSVIIKPIKLKLKRSHKAAKTFIISSNSQEIINTLNHEGFCDDVVTLTDIDSIPKCTEPVNIILDDREMSYDSIITSIMSHNHDKRFFHIYSSRNNLIISPKTQR